MFDKYINEIKKKEFAISMLILSIIGLVCYAYHFMPMVTADDEAYLFSSNVETFTSFWHTLFSKDPRAIGFALSTVLNDGTNGKNLVLFSNIIGSAFFSLFFVRFGLNVKSIFWSILLAAPLFINAVSRIHFSYVINIIRYIPVWYTLTMVLAIFIERKLINIVVISFILFIAIWTYALTTFTYIMGVGVLSIYYIIQNQNLDLKTLIKELLLNKIIPAVLILIIAMLSHKILVKLTIEQGADNIFNPAYYTIRSYPIAQCIEKIKLLTSYYIFNNYPATMHNGLLIFTILFLAGLFSVFAIFKQQQLKKQIALAILTVITMMALFIAGNIGLILTPYLQLRMFVADCVYLTLILYLIYIAMNQIKWLKNINLVLSLIFVMQLGNQTVYKSYKHLMFYTAKKARLNRLFTDVGAFARAHNIKNKVPVFLFGNPFDYNNARRFIDTKSSHYYLHYDNLYLYYVPQKIRHNVPYMLMLGVNDYFRAPDTEMYKDKASLKKMCLKITNDKTMNMWPYANSMKIIDGVIYVKTTDDMKPQHCEKITDYYQYENILSPPLIPLRDGYYNLAR